MKISKLILRSIKKDGPATAPELGAIGAQNSGAWRRDGAVLETGCNLRTEGKLKVVGKVARAGHRGTKLMANLYNLAA